MILRGYAAEWDDCEQHPGIGEDRSLEFTFARLHFIRLHEHRIPGYEERLACFRHDEHGFVYLWLSVRQLEPWMPDRRAAAVASDEDFWNPETYPGDPRNVMRARREILS